MKTETIAAPAAATNGAQMRVVLDGRAEARTFADKVKAAPRAFRTWVTATLKTLKMDAAVESAADGARWALAKMQPVLNILKGLGLTNLAGIVATIPEVRRFTVKVAHTVYRVVTAPVRWAWGALRWGLSKFGWGRKVVETVETKIEQVHVYAAVKVETGIRWMESNELHPAMKWARWFFQASIIRNAVRMAFPGLAPWVSFLAMLAVPTITYSAAESEHEEAAVQRAKTVLAEDKPAAAKAAAPKAQSAGKAKEAPAAATVVMEKATEVIEKATEDVKTATEEIKGELHTTQPKVETVILTDSARPAGEPPFEAEAITDHRGERRIRLGSQLLLEEDLPDTVRVVGTVAGPVAVTDTGIDVEKTVREAQASATGKPPTLPRAATRQASKRPAKTGRRR